MFEDRKPDEIDNLWNAYMTCGDWEYSDNFKLLQEEFENFFKFLVFKNVISDSKYFELDEKLGDIISEAENQAFRQGFTKGLDLKTAVVTVIKGGKK